MKNLMLPIAIIVTMLTGCSLHLHDQAESLVKPKSATPQATQTISKPITSDQAYIRVSSDQIDFQHLEIDCDVTKQLITVKQGDRIVRTMPTSSGLDTIPDNTTPLGTFYVQPERGTWFYSEEYQEGAKYWTSWKDHGVFLFHSVVMDKNGTIKQDEARKLGTKASHGCFRLPVEDAKWIYDNIKVGTKVVVHK
ncbi:MAG: L,D-transpeptidase [Tumebacillaceae bacterium]